MKIRKDFVTNSSSSSFICCFARVADPEKAKAILEKHEDTIQQYSAQDVLAELDDNEWSTWLEWEWAGIDVTPSENYVAQHMDDVFVLVTNSEELYEDEDGDVNYNVNYEDFDKKTISAIDDISEENGFAEIDMQYGAGRNG